MSDNLEFLFRYFSLSDGTIEKRIKPIFTERKLFFPSPKKFNDPFDCNVDIVRFTKDKNQWNEYLKGMVKRLHPGWNRQQRNEWVRERIKERSYEKISVDNIMEGIRNRFYQHGILCLTEVPDNLLMWSHYADGHRGFCLCFDCENSFFGRANDVKYIKIYPELIGPDYPDNEWITAMVFSKSEEWKYEREWRIVKIGGGGQSHEYPEGALKKVFFGCQMKEKHKIMISGWAQAISPAPELFEYIRKKREFGLKLQRWVPRS